MNGVQYHFTTVEQMKKDIAAGKFIEHADVYGNLYGTSFAAVEAVQQSGRICVFDVDVQGTRTARSRIALLIEKL